MDLVVSNQPNEQTLKELHRESLKYTPSSFAYSANLSKMISDSLDFLVGVQEQGILLDEGSVEQAKEEFNYVLIYPITRLINHAQYYRDFSNHPDFNSMPIPEGCGVSSFHLGSTHQVITLILKKKLNTISDDNS